MISPKARGQRGGWGGYQSINQQGWSEPFHIFYLSWDIHLHSQTLVLVILELSESDQDCLYCLPSDYQVYCWRYSSWHEDSQSLSLWAGLQVFSTFSSSALSWATWQRCQPWAHWSLKNGIPTLQNNVGPGVPWTMPPALWHQAQTLHFKNIFLTWCKIKHTHPLSIIHCVYVLVAQLCLTLCNLMDCSLPGSSVHGILQVRILEWVAIPFQGVIHHDMSLNPLPGTAVEPPAKAVPRGGSWGLGWAR